MENIYTPLIRRYLRSILILCIQLFISLSANAQQIVSVSAKIADREQQEVFSGSIIISSAKDSSIVATSFWEKGTMTIEAGAGRALMIKLSSVGYSHKIIILSADQLNKGSKIDLGTVIMEKDNTLKEITVTGRKQLIRVSADKIIFNIAESGLAIGGTADEVLKKAPQVLINSDGSASVAGKGKANIYLDGMLINPDLLKSIPSGNIDRIEIVRNPSAKYDAAGGAIINIVSKKNSLFSSYLNTDESVTKGRRWRESIGLQTGLKRSKWNADLKYRFYPSRIQQEDLFDRNISRGADTVNLHQMVTKNRSFGNRQSFDLTAGIALSKSVSFNGGYTALILRGTGNDNGLNTGSANTPGGGLVLNNFTESRISNNTHILNYGLSVIPGKEDKLNISANHTWYNYSKNDDIAEQFAAGNQVDQSLKRNYNTNKIMLTTIMADYSHVINKDMNVEFGGKMLDTRNNSSVVFSRLRQDQWVDDIDEYNSYRYVEKIYAAYGNLNAKISKFDLQAGLRVEKTDADGVSNITGRKIADKSYTNLFPSVNVNYMLDKDFDLNTTYQRRINRPKYQDLNPYRLYIDSLSVFSGNPLLQPEIADYFEGGITYKKMASLKIGYTSTRNSIQTVIRQLDNNSLVTLATLENLNRVNAFNVTLSLPYQVGIWTTYNMISYTRNDVSAKITNVAYDLSKPFWVFYSYNQFNLPGKLQLELTGTYNTSGIMGIFEFRPKFNLSASVKKELVKNKWYISLAGNDIFNTDIVRTSTALNNFKLKYRGFEDSQYIRLSVAYKIGKTWKNNKNAALDDRLKKADQ